MKNLVFLFVNGRYDFSQLLFHMKVGVDMDINETGFGKLSNGREAVLYTLCNQQGTTVKITDYGARIVAWSVKDKDDHLIDIVLGYEDAKTYEKKTTNIWGQLSVVVPIVSEMLNLR